MIKGGSNKQYNIKHAKIWILLQHDAYISERSENSIKCIVHDDHGFTCDYLSFIVVELIRFSHGALQLEDMQSSSQITPHNTDIQFFNRK